MLSSTPGLGPAYALLRREVLRARRVLRSRGGAIRKVLVVWLEAQAKSTVQQTFAAAVRRCIEIDVLVGALNRRRTQLLELHGKRPNVHWQTAPPMSPS